MNEYKNLIILLTKYKINNLKLNEIISILKISEYNYYKNGRIEGIIKRFLIEILFFYRPKIKSFNISVSERNYLKEEYFNKIFIYFNKIHTPILSENIIFFEKLFIFTFKNELKNFYQDFNFVKLNNKNFNFEIFVHSLSTDLFLSLVYNNYFAIKTRLY